MYTIRWIERRFDSEFWFDFRGFEWTHEMILKGKKRCRVGLSEQTRFWT